MKTKVSFLSGLEQRRRNARLDNEEFKPLRGTASLTPSPPEPAGVCRREVFLELSEEGSECHGPSASTGQRLTRSSSIAASTTWTNAGTSASLSDQVTAENLLGRRMVDSVLLVYKTGIKPR